MFKRIVFLLFLGSLAGSFLRAQSTYDEWCERISATIEGDSLTQAQDYIRHALRLDPSNPRNAMLFANLGTIQQRQGQYEMALESYRLALNIVPTSVPILLSHAGLSLEMGHDDNARADYSQVIELEPHHEEALVMRAYIYMRQRAYKQARQDYDTLLKYAPANYSGRLGLATLHQREHRYEEALKVLDPMLQGNVTDTLYSSTEQATIYTLRAGVEIDMQHTDQALLDLEEAIRLDNTQAEAYLMRGQIYLSQKKKQQARSDFEKAISLGVPQAEIRKLLRASSK